MKKIISILIVIIIFVSASAYAAEVLPFKIKLDGRYLEFDQPPIIENDRVMVPIRTIFEALGAEVSWDEPTKTATAVKGDITVKVEMKKEPPEVTVNGLYVWCDVPPMNINDRILVPIRVISQSFENLVDWEHDSRTVIITSYDETSLALNKKLSGFWINSDYFDKVKEKRSIAAVSDYTLVNFYRNSVSKLTFHQGSGFVPLGIATEIPTNIYEISPISNGNDQLFPPNCKFIVDNSEAEITLSMDGMKMMGFKSMTDLERHATRLIFPNEFTDTKGNRIRINTVWLDTIDVPGEDCVNVTDMILTSDESYIFEFTFNGLNLYELAHTDFGVYERGELKFSLIEVKE